MSNHMDKIELRATIMYLNFSFDIFEMDKAKTITKVGKTKALTKVSKAKPLIKLVKISRSPYQGG